MYLSTLRVSRNPVAALLAFGWWLLALSASAADLNGQQLYVKYCAPCHGQDGRGNGPDADIFAERPRDLRTGFLKKYPADDLVRRIRTGTPLELALDPPALKARAGEVNTLVAYLKKLPSIDWKQTEVGWAIYAERCAVCHGPYGDGSKHLPSGVRPPRDLSSAAFQKSISEDELMLVVRHGRQGMPALVPRVPEAAGPPLAAFVRLLSPGFTLYSRYCAGCHGDDGLGVRELGILDMPEVKFDRQYFAHHDAEQLHTAVWHMLASEKPAMPHYRWIITDAEARAIVSYLQTLEPGS